MVVISTSAPLFGVGGQGGGRVRHILGRKAGGDQPSQHLAGCFSCDLWGLRFLNKI
jgi:hypothetical protein